MYNYSELDIFIDFQKTETGESRAFKNPFNTEWESFLDQLAHNYSHYYAN